MRTVSNLLNLKGRVYVYMRSRNLIELFMKNSENEGFTFGDGVKPAEREGNDIMALNRDWTINYVGWAGHLAFRNPQAVIGEPLIRVDYGKYLQGAEDFLCDDRAEAEKTTHTERR